jgi:energy-coupling factor transporter ATP-binding protein EcfA2
LTDIYSAVEPTLEAIKIENLTHRYPNGHLALKGVTLQIERGKAIALLGRNGAGKTTLAKHLNSLLKPTTGKVTVMGLDASERTTSEMARIVGYVFQNPEDQLFGATVAEEVAFGPKNIGMKKPQIEESVNEALFQVGLTDHASTHPYNLTYSQRKMLCIASVLAMDPDILVLDEPNAGQDLWGLARLGRIADQLHGKGKTVIIISHDIEFVARHTDRTVVMHDGVVFIEGATRTILSDSLRLATLGLRPPQATLLAIGLDHRAISTNSMTPEEVAGEIIAVVNRRRTPFK